MSEYFSEIFRIVEGAMRGDTQKVKAYAGLLADKAEADGHASTAERLRKIIAGNPGVQVFTPRPIGGWQSANEIPYPPLPVYDNTSTVCPACGWKMSGGLVQCTNCNTPIPLCWCSHPRSYHDDKGICQAERIYNGKACCHCGQYQPKPSEGGTVFISTQ